MVVTSVIGMNLVVPGSSTRTVPVTGCAFPLLYSTGTGAAAAAGALGGGADDVIAVDAGGSGPGAPPPPPPPPPPPVGLTLKLAVADLSPFKVRSQVPVPAQAPDQPSKVDPVVGVAARLTSVPFAALVEHVPGQATPAPVTDPVPAPASETSTLCPTAKR